MKSKLHSDGSFIGGSNTGDITIFLTDKLDVDERLYDPNKPIPEETTSTTSSTSSSVATSTVIQQGKLLHIYNIIYSVVLKLSPFL